MAISVRDPGDGWAAERDGRRKWSASAETGASLRADDPHAKAGGAASWLSALRPGRSRVADAHVAPNPPARSVHEEERFLGALDDLVRSKFASPRGLDGRLAAAFDRLGRYVKSANSKCLKSLARLGAQACEATINMGWVFHDAREVAQSTESISSAVEQMAASISELSSSSDASASQAEMARDTMRSCISDSRGATEAMATIEARGGNIEQRLGVLQTAVDQISGMAGNVEAIARQTNLLALNATIEAARAGEHGRGFAVVASEVKALSLETTKATKDIHVRVGTLKEEMKGISAAVKDSLNSVAAGSAVVKQVGTIIAGVGDEVSEIADRIRGLSDLLQQQRAATSEIAHNAARISEKATKTRDEVASIGRRLQECETVVVETLDAASDWPTDSLGLIRFAADAAVWKRRLSSILLAVDPALETAPRLEVAQDLAEAERRCAEHSAARTLIGEFTHSVAEAQRYANEVVSEVRKSNWGAATPAYVACEKALSTAIAAAAKLAELSGTEATH